MNRLANALSPYLRQHKDNPVHWQPWDDASLRQAADEDKPIFLSVGYSSCHWCHVMEHESFEDEAVATLLNANFVCIKVDREEKPDVDETYMTAVQLANGHGGWPMSLFLTPDLRPFWAGTYLPKEDRGPHPGFKTLLKYLSQVWRLKRDEIEHAASEYASLLEQTIGGSVEAGTAVLGREAIDAAVQQAKQHFDRVNGGFKGKPKFPPHSMLRLLLLLAEHEKREDCLAFAAKTLDAMMLGGIHDHVGGGFHRYSTDAKWLLPHFEKMLYDNALLLRNYADAYRITNNGEYKRVCERIVSWAEREMLSPEGLFYSALDADSEGEEGKFYVWEWNEVVSVAGEEFAKTFQCAKRGNFTDEATGKPAGMNILHLDKPVGDKYDAELADLLSDRSKRVRPELDDKGLIAWNGLMISGLCAFGRTDLAQRCAEAILRHPDLPHMIVRGQPAGLPFLDQAYFIEGLLDLGMHEQAAQLFETSKNQFRAEHGGWYFTSDRHQQLFGRSKSIADSATPSPSATMTRCALRLGKTDIAIEDIAASGGWLERAPMGCSSMLQVLAMSLSQGHKVNGRTVKIEVSPEEANVVNGIVNYEIKLTLQHGWHLNEEPSIAVAGLDTVSTNGLRITGTVPAGDQGEAKCIVQFQICNDRECLAPEKREVSLAWRREGKR